MTTTWRAALVLTLAIGCNGGPPDQFDTELTETTPASQLDASQASAFCAAAGDHTESYLTSRKDKLCLFQAILAAGFAELTGRDPAPACEEALTECNTTFDLGPRRCALSSSSCSATIGELEACYNDTISSLERIFDHIESVSNCAEALNYMGETLELTDVQSCASIEDACPGIELGLPTGEPE